LLTGKEIEESVKADEAGDISPLFSYVHERRLEIVNVMF